LDRRNQRGGNECPRGNLLRCRTLPRQSTSEKASGAPSGLAARPLARGRDLPQRADCRAASSERRIAAAITLPSRGGTALPICLTICALVPRNVKESGKLWMRAPSRGVSARSWYGWIHLFDAGCTKLTVNVVLGRSGSNLL